MTDVKAQELSYNEWRELLEPYGWADITTTAPAVRFQVPSPLLEYGIRVMLKPGREVSEAGGECQAGDGEWAERSYLLGRARDAVNAVKARGYWFPDAPRIEFGGRYMHLMGDAEPRWVAEAELRFTVRPRT
jgi:hypothetical protein